VNGLRKSSNNHLKAQINVITITASEVIKRPIDEVFAYAGDYRNDTAWRRGVVEMRYEGADEAAEGVLTFEVMRSMGMKNTTVAEVNEYIPERRTAFRSISGPVPCHGFREFQESAEGTTFTYVLTLEPRGVMRLLKPLLRTMFQKQVGEDVRRLKAKLEHTNLQTSF
jgi:uncharacterized membrane protein